MTTTHAAAAAQIRAELKRHGIKARVTSQIYSGGSSIRVRIDQDVLPAQCDAVEAFCGRYQYGHFDGMTDCYEYSNTSKDLPQVKFVFVEVDYSETIRQAAREFVENYYGSTYPDRDTLAWRTLNGSAANGFWTSRKPRVRLQVAA